MLPWALYTSSRLSLTSRRRRNSFRPIWETQIPYPPPAHMKAGDIGDTEVKHSPWYPRRGHRDILFDINNKEQVPIADCFASDRAPFLRGDGGAYPDPMFTGPVLSRVVPFRALIFPYPREGTGRPMHGPTQSRTHSAAWHGYLVFTSPIIGSMTVHRVLRSSPGASLAQLLC